jgi:hypothetical protein
VELGAMQHSRAGVLALAARRGANAAMLVHRCVVLAFGRALSAEARLQALSAGGLGDIHALGVRLQHRVDVLHGSPEARRSSAVTLLAARGVPERVSAMHTAFLRMI